MFVRKNYHFKNRCPQKVSGYDPDTISERKALYHLKNDKSIVIKSADKGSAVAVWDREDYI